MRVETKACPLCDTSVFVDVPGDGWTRFLGGDFIQDAFPGMDDGLRERFVSGVCPGCWDVLFVRDDDEAVWS